MKSAAFVLVFFFSIPAYGVTPKTFEVPKLGGTFEASVLRGQTTPLVFPYPVTKTIGWSTDGYMIKRFQSNAPVPPPNIVTIEPDKNASWALLSIHAGPIQVHLLMTPVDEPARAHSPVLFVPREAEEQFRARVDRAVAERLKPLRLEAEDAKGRYEALLAREDMAITNRAMQIIADGVRMDTLHRRTCSRSIRGTARGSGMVLRLHEIRWLGSHAFIVFSVLNRGSRDYLIRDVSLRKEGAILPIATSFSSPDKTVHVIRPSLRQVGVIGLADADAFIGQHATLRIAGPNGSVLEVQFPFVAGHDR